MINREDMLELSRRMTPARASVARIAGAYFDKEWLEGSEEVYTYLLCTLSPLEGEYEPGKPTSGFLYPAFKERSGNREYMNVLRLG